MGTIALEINNITKVYRDNCVLDINELRMCSSGFVAIIGDSGSGKTTLLNTIGLLDNCNTGTISLFNNKVDISDIDMCSDFRKRYIGYMFQDDILFNNRTVKDNIEYPLEISNSKNDEKICHITQAFAIEDLMIRYPFELSRGQRQRVALARAVVGNKKIILADEPTGNLDEENSQVIFEYLKELSEEKLVVIATHNVEMARKYADRIIQLADGKIKKDFYVETSKHKEVSFSEDDSFEMKEHCNLSMIMKHALSDVKSELKNSRKVFVSGALMTIIFVLAIATFINSKKELGDMENKYFGKNYICLSPNIDFDLETAFTGRYSLGHYLGDYSFLDSDKDVQEYTKYYDCSLSIEKGMESYPITDLTSIKCNEYFESKVNYLGIDGSMISGDDEIILASDIAEWYYGKAYDEHLGDKIEVNAAFGKYEFTVVGFNRKKNVNGNIQSYMTENAMYNVALNEASLDCSEDDASIYGPCSYQFLEYDESGVGESYMIGEEKMAEVTNNIHNAKVLVGEEPRKADEAMISNAFLQANGKDLFGLVIDDSNVNSVEFLEKYILGNDIYIVFDYSGAVNKVRITGIFENSNAGDVLVSDKGLEQLCTVYPTQIDLFLKDNADVEKITTKVYNAGFLYEQPYENYKDGISERFLTLKIIFGVIAIIVLVVLIVVINTFTSNNIQNHKKDIGLLMAMGMYVNNIKKIYIIESSLLGVLTEIIAVIILGFLKFVFRILYELIGAGWVSLLNFSFLEVFLAVFLGICVFSLAAIPSVDKNICITPKEAIYY